jgi:hypothetical protein
MVVFAEAPAHSMFEIETSHADRIISLRMIGGFTMEGARQCAAAKEAAVEKLGPPYDTHSTLVDVRDLRIQSRDIFAIFTNFVATTRHKSRKIAIVGGEGTARMQFRRVAEREPMRDDMRFFTAVSEARDWLEQSAGRAAPAAVVIRN